MTVNERIDPSDAMQSAGGELWAFSATQLATLVVDREVSAREVVQAHLDRIESVNPAVNAISAVLAESALADADRVDGAVRAGAPLGPFAGVPFTVKENIDVEGQPTTAGVAAFRDRTASADAPSVRQLRRAGGIPIARSNMPDFGMRWHTDNALFGATRNPWDGALSPMGSSGGEAVALATGMSPLGLGNDYGGSVRLPSAAAGTVGLRPTAGRLASATTTNPFPPPPTIQLFAVDGPMGRRVADVRLAFENLCGPDPRDPLWTPVPPRLPVPQRLRVAVMVDPGDAGVHPEEAAAVRRAADALELAGADVREVQPPHLLEAAQLWRELTTAEMGGLLEGLVRPLGSPDAATYLAQSIEHVPMLDLAGYVSGLARRHAVAAAWSEFFIAHDVLLGPVSAGPAPAVGFDIGGPDNADSLWHDHRFVVALNLLGLPALAMPAGLGEDGRPHGVQLVCDRFHESTALHAGQLVEAVCGAVTPIDPR